LFDVYFLVGYVLLSISCVLCFCTILCIASPYVYSCLFSTCVQVYRQLPPGETPIAVNKYIISCIILTRILVHIHTHAGERIFGIFSGMAQSMECVCEVKTLISLRWPYSPNVSCNSASVKYHTSYAPTICLKIWQIRQTFIKALLTSITMLRCLTEWSCTSTGWGEWPASRFDPTQTGSPTLTTWEEAVSKPV
jgi:hypothetical protein